MPHDGDSGEQLFAQPQIDGHGITRDYAVLNQGSQTTFPKVERDAERRTHPARAQVTNCDRNTEQGSDMTSRHCVRVVANVGITRDLHSNCLLAHIADEWPAWRLRASASASRMIGCFQNKLHQS